LSDIFIDPKNGRIALKIEVGSLQPVSFAILVLAPDGNTELESHPGNSQDANPFTIPLKDPIMYKDCYLTGTFVITDPKGEGNKYLVLFSVVQDEANLTPVITLSGITTDKDVLRTGVFHVRE
jgi:hypothetical protein